MRLRINSSINEYILWSGIVVGLAVRLYLAWQPVQSLVMRYNADDAYYYFTIARNIVTGHGVSFDGLVPTNGFHPLYLVLLVPIFALTHNAVELAVHLSLSLLAVFNVLTVLPMYRVLKHVLDDEVALVASIAWLFNPWVVAITMLGVESALYVLLLAWTVERYVRWRMDRTERRQLIVVGILAGLTVLARSDAVFLLAAISVDGIILSWNKTLVRDMVAWGIPCGIIIMPWFGWNMLTLGTIVQTSGTAILYRGQSAYVPYSNPLEIIFINSFAFMLFQGILFLVAVLASSIVLWRHRISPTRHGQAGLRPLSFLGVYACLWFCFYVWYFRHFQLWYFLPILFIATLGIGYLYAYWKTFQAQLSRLLLPPTLIFFLVTFTLSGWFWYANDIGLYLAQANGYIIARWVSENTEPQARVGAWNSGVIGYFSTRTVVNLDGVVNNELYQYVSNRHGTFSLKDLRDYVRQKQITYITDYESLCDESALKGVDWIQPVFEFPSLYGNCRVRVYRVMDDDN